MGLLYPEILQEEVKECLPTRFTYDTELGEGKGTDTQGHRLADRIGQRKLHEIQQGCKQMQIPACGKE